jgi:uncharacterized protein YndB with AHSA1/START domain
MSARSNAVPQNPEIELRITRVFDAPRSLLWTVWTQPAHLMRWWGPRGYTLVSCNIDLRPGGSYRFHMRGPTGDDHWSQGVFEEVIEPQRLVLAGSWVDADGSPTGPQTVATVSFEENAGKTTMTFHHRGFDTVAARDAHRGGWGSSFDRLDQYMASL